MAQTSNISDINIFDVVNNYAKLRGYYQQYNRQALNWYKNEISKLGNINKLKLLGDNIEYQQSTPQVGSFCLFFYSAKGYREKTLPYFDAFPLTIMLDSFSTNGNNYVSGLNVHYLPPMQRLQLLTKIIEIQGSTFGQAQKLNVTYELIKSATNLYKPTYHTYLIKEIRSRVVVIPPESVTPAVFLPIASWKGASQTKVWSNSRKIIL